MASYIHQEVTRIRHEWRVPGAEHGGWGAAIAEVHKAIAAAEARYREIYGMAPSFGDWLRVWAADEEIVLWFEQEAEKR